MENAGTERAKGTRNRLGGGSKQPENAKKILNRGNEPKDLLKSKDLAFSGAQNELFLECKKTDQSEKRAAIAQALEQESGFRTQDSGPKSEDSGDRKVGALSGAEPGVRSQIQEHLLSAFCPLLSAFCTWGEFKLTGSLAPYHDLRQDVIADRKIKDY
jgi:hypothetical protein